MSTVKNDKEFTIYLFVETLNKIYIYIYIFGSNEFTYRTEMRLWICMYDCMYTTMCPDKED